MEHEVAKLIGRPARLSRHRETQPMPHPAEAQRGHQREVQPLDRTVRRDRKGRALHDRLLLGILDRAILRLGDNTSVNFA